MNTDSTALVLVGYQNDYFASGGILRGLVEEPGRVDSTLSNTLRLLDCAAETDMTIITTPMILGPEYRAQAESDGVLESIRRSGAFRRGGVGAETIPELKAFGSRIISLKGKQSFNAFSNTSLEATLRLSGVKHVMLAGLPAALCIDSTARAAYERGYAVSVLRDCVAARTRQEQKFYCETIFPLYADVIDSRNVMARVRPAMAA